jgi:hypothetical protein
MLFRWGRSTSESLDIGESEDAPYELAAIELLTTDGRFTGWIATEGDRTSDWLNDHAQVPLHGLSEVASADGSATSPPAPDAAATSPSHVDRGRLIWAIPPPLPSNRHLRLHRRRVLVHLELDEHEVSGQVHVRPGADAADQLLRGTRDLVPLTEVQVVSRRDPGESFSVPVLVVNRQHVRRVVEDRTEDPHQRVALPVTGSVDPDDPRLAFLEPVEAEPPTSEDPPEAAEDADAADPAAPEAEDLQQALQLLLDAGVVDVVEFQSIRARIVAPAAE